MSETDLGAAECNQLMNQYFSGGRTPIYATFHYYETSNHGSADNQELNEFDTLPSGEGLSVLLWTKSQKKAFKPAYMPGKQWELFNRHGSGGIGIVATIELPLHAGKNKKEQKAEQQMSRHAILMEVAKGPAYQGKWTRNTKKMGLHKAYDLDCVSYDSGFSCAFLKPKDGSKDPAILAFRGTDDLADAWTDLSARGVGQEQFDDAKGKIKQFLNKAKGAKNGLLVTGHSLGGALAQICGAVFSGDYPISEVVTFQAPGISAELVKQFKKLKTKPDVTHYTMEGGVVAAVGEAALTGDTIQQDLPEQREKGDLITLHTKKPLSRKKGGQYRLRDSGAKTMKKHPADQDREEMEAARQIVGKILRDLFSTLNLPPPRADFEVDSKVLKAAIKSLFVNEVQHGYTAWFLKTKKRVKILFKLISEIKDKSLKQVLSKFIHSYIDPYNRAVYDLVIELQKAETKTGPLVDYFHDKDYQIHLPF